jgi:hypothetical protein
MIYYHLPGLFEYFGLYNDLVRLYTSERDKFNDCEIGSIYGAPPNTLWTGGRSGVDGCSNIFEVLNWSQENNIHCNLTFTNCLLSPDMFLDKYCNLLLNTFHEDGNVITVFSDELKQYITERYPLYHFTSSTTKCIRDKKQVLQEIQNYDIVVLDYNFNRDMEFLQSIPQKEKCELLINPVCSPNCPQRFQHYVEISEFALGIKDDSSREIYCPCQGEKFWKALKYNPLVLSIEDVKEYSEKGFQHFKIEGRTTDPADLIEILVYYMVKPEHQLEIRQRLLYRN